MADVLTPHTSLWLADKKGYQRAPLWGVHVFPLLDPVTCQALIDLADVHGSVHGWSTGRHKHFPTVDIAVDQDTSPEIYDKLRPSVVDATILPTLAMHFGHFDAKTELTIADMFVVKYEAATVEAEAEAAETADRSVSASSERATGGQDRLAFHRDGSLLSFSILLSDPADFDGGGLRFHSLGPLCEVCRGPPCQGEQCAACIAACAAAAAAASKAADGESPVASVYNAAAARAAAHLCERCHGVGRAQIPNCGRGDLTAHCGKLLHEGARVTRCKRYIVVGFVRVKAPRIDHEFVEKSLYANSASRGGESDYELVEEAYDPEKGRWRGQRWGTNQR